MSTFIKTIFITCVFCTAHFSAFAQNISVSGTVTDANGEPIPGVSVLVKGNTTLGTVANNNGAYQITVPSASSVLQFSFIGFTTVEKVVGSQRIIDVTMKEEVSTLDEVVVVAYGTQKKNSLTSAISSVQTNELLKSPTTSLGNALAGRLPGLGAIQYSGLPGYDDPTIYIRGVGTLSESNSRPLILVDGVERPFTQLDPNEVADISILKDAGATAVYGVRGANGVILVTTKRGQLGKPTVTASVSYGIQQPMKIVEFADSYLYATTYVNAQIGDGLTDVNAQAFSPEAIEHFRLRDQPLLYPSVDWMSYIIKKQAPRNQFNVNVSGGNDRAKYFVSVGRNFEDGLFNTFAADPRENWKYERYNYRANLDINLTKSTILSTTLGGRIENRNSPNDGWTAGGADGPNREGTIFRYLVEAAPMAGAGVVDGKHIIYNQQLMNLTFMRDGLDTFYARGFKNEVSNVLNFDLKVNQKLDMITQGLDFTFKGAYNSKNILRKVRYSAYNGMMGVPTYVPWPVRDADNNIIDVVLEKRTDSQVYEYREEYDYARDWYFDASFNYNHSFNNKTHNVTALLLYNQSKNYYPDSYTDIPRGYIGVVARATYDYKMKYLLDVSMGYNGSENFAPGKRYGLFPSASVGWIITEEDFMKGQKILEYFKIRYSNGLVGNDGGIGRFLYLPASYALGMTGRGRNTAMGDGTAFGIRGQAIAKQNVKEARLGNPNITWEKARKQNLGFDLKTLTNRLSVNFDYFTEHRWDILTTPDALIPTHFALPNIPAINYSVVDNHGYEVQLTWTDKVGSDFQYTIAPNMSYSKNKRVKILEVPPTEPYQSALGTPVGQPYGYKFYSFYHEGMEEDYVKYMMSRPEYAEYAKKRLEANPNWVYTFPNHGVNLKPGDIVVLDLNYDGIIDANDQRHFGYPNYAEFNFGLNMNFKYKRFELSMLWIGSTNTARDLGGAYRPAFGGQNTGSLVKWVAENSWTADNPNAPFPRITFANRTNNERFCEVFLVDASYARLKNLEFAYNLNVKKIPYVESLSLFATAYNLLTFTKYHANDPETSGAGWQEFFRYPPTRIYNVGFRLTF